MGRKNLALALTLSLAALGGCAPDAWNSRQSTGYNAFVNRIAQECAPLELGPYQMSQQIERNMMDDNYIYFLDITSRLYYGHITVAAYRSAINGFFMGGATTDVALDCIISKLPQTQK